MRMKSLLMLVVVFILTGVCSADSLLLHYSFDGSVADPNVLAWDYSGNFYDGIITGDPAGSTDVPEALAGGNSWSCDTGDWIDPNVPDPNTMLKPTNYTIAFWTKATGAGTRVLICSPTPADTSAQSGTSIYSRSNGGLRLYHNGQRIITDSETGAVFTPDWSTPPVWTHVAVTVDTDNNQVALYVDGLERVSKGATLAPMEEGFARICSSKPDGTYFSYDDYNGLLDDFRVYDYALTEAEIQALLGIENTPPQVEAGGIHSATGGSGFQTVGIDSTLQLDGSYTDDGNPVGGTITTQWSVVDSAQDPNVTIDNPNVLDPNVTFDTTGFYTLRLTVNDGELDGTDDIVIRVKDVTDTLQVHMKFTGDANDLTDDYNLNTEITGTPEFVPGAVGNALKLDEGDVVKFGTELGAETSISVALWIQPDPAISNGIAARKRTGNSGTPGQGGWEFNPRAGHLYQYCNPGWDNGAGRLDYPVTWTGQWVHAVLTYDVDTQEQLFYVDGVLHASRTSGFTSFDSISDLQLGGSGFFGLIDELYIYDYVIDDAKVRELFTEGGNAPPVVTIDGEQAKILLPTNQVNLSGSVTDESSYTTLWTVEEKPAGSTVTFGDATAESTTATFDTAGDYVLRLTATDVGALTGDDEFLVKVRPSGFDGLEAHITFENADPSLAVNSTVGIGYQGTIYGTAAAGTAASDAQVGTGALELFNTVTPDRIQTDYVAYNRFLGSDPALTVSVWFKCENTGTDNTIIAKTSGDSSGLGWFIRVRNGDDSISAMVGSDWASGEDLRGPVGSINQNEWVHAVLTFEDGVQRLYQNGALVREETGIQYSTGDIVSPMTIGRRDDENWAFFDGLIDEVRIYDYALSVEEVKSLYAGDGGLPWNTCLTPGITGDLNLDCRVDMLDMAELGAGWQSGYTMATLESVALDWLECDDLDLSKCF